MNISARRLAIVVLVAAAALVAVSQGLNLILGLRNDSVGLEIGVAGNVVLILSYVLAPVLLVVAGVLAIRSRRAGLPEIVALGVIGGEFMVLGLLATGESVIGAQRYTLVEYMVPVGIVSTGSILAGAIVVIAMPTLIGIAIASTIRPPRQTATDRGA